MQNVLIQYIIPHACTDQSYQLLGHAAVQLVKVASDTLMHDRFGEPPENQVNGWLRSAQQLVKVWL